MEKPINLRLKIFQVYWVLSLDLIPTKISKTGTNSILINKDEFEGLLEN